MLRIHGWIGRKDRQRAARLEIVLRDELGAGASGDRPAHLRPDLPEARNGDVEQLADQEMLVRLDPAAFIRNVAELYGRARSVGAAHDSVDGDRLAILAPDPPMNSQHDNAPAVPAVYVKAA